MGPPEPRSAGAVTEAMLAACCMLTSMLCQLIWDVLYLVYFKLNVNNNKKNEIKYVCITLPKRSRAICIVPGQFDCLNNYYQIALSYWALFIMTGHYVYCPIYHLVHNIYIISRIIMEVYMQVGVIIPA